ncbi:MAG: hypothetical protein ACE1S7_06250, partial [Candidatus Tisiphia sp.]
MLPAKTVTVYYNSTMNEAHKRHIKNEFNEGRVSIIDENMHLHLGLSERLCKYDVRVSPSLIDTCPFLV